MLMSIYMHIGSHIPRQYVRKISVMTARYNTAQFCDIQSSSLVTL